MAQFPHSWDPASGKWRSDLKAPPPRTPDGKPDFSGMWFANVPSRDICREEDCIQEERMAREQINIGTRLQGGLPYTEWSRARLNFGIMQVEIAVNDPKAYTKPWSVTIEMAEVWRCMPSPYDELLS